MSHAQNLSENPHSGFSLSPTLPLSDEARRLLFTQAEDALTRLSHPSNRASAVHNARKACKRGRAILSLIQPALGDDDHRLLLDGFRSAAQEVGPIRDADVMRQLAQELGIPLPDPIDEIEGRRRLAASRARLEALRNRLAALPLRIKREHVIVGFERNYRKARRRMVLAQADPSGEALHEWRKAVKAHSFHLRLLEPLWPPILGALAAEADLLQEMLGDHHDLTVLREHPSTTDAAPLQARLAALETSAFAHGARLYATHHRVLGAWLRSQWSALPSP